MNVIMSRRMERMPPLVAVLGGAGLIPFVIGALLAWTSPALFDLPIIRLLIVYAAAILSFLGGAIWGIASATLTHDPFDEHHPLLFTASVVPSLIAWIAVFLSDRVGLGVLALSFLAMLWLDDRVAVANLVPVWWTRLRRVLTAVVFLSLVCAILAPAAAIG